MLFRLVVILCIIKAHFSTQTIHCKKTRVVSNELGYLSYN